MSEQRRYTVAEIDELRRVVERRWLFGTTAPLPLGYVLGRHYQIGEKDKAVEELVRTHMIAGHVAADILAADQEAPK